MSSNGLIGDEIGKNSLIEIEIFIFIRLIQFVGRTTNEVIRLFRIVVTNQFIQFLHHGDQLLDESMEPFHHRSIDNTRLSLLLRGFFGPTVRSVQSEVVVQLLQLLLLLLLLMEEDDLWHVERT